MLLVLRSILLWVLSNNVAGHLVNLQNHFKFYNVLFSVVKNRKY